MKNELGIHGNARDPARQFLFEIKMCFARAARRDVMAEALQLKRGSPAGRDGQIQQER